jgi:Icc-related predicted phosphoesterase
VTEGTATSSSSIVGSTVVVNLSGVTNQQYVTVTLSSVSSTDGGTGGTGVARVGFLLGDVNQSRVVLLSDLVLVNAQLAKLVSSTNFLKDVNANGTLTVGDIIITNANLAKALPAP